MTKLLITVVALLVAAFVTCRAESSSKKETLPADSNPMIECGSKMTDECPDEIFEFVFNEGKTVSQECCTQVKRMGKECHDLLTILTVYGEHFEQDVIDILKRSNTAWRRCDTHGVITAV